MDKGLGRYDAPALQRLFEAGGVVEMLQVRGFDNLEIAVESAGRALPHVLLSGR